MALARARRADSGMNYWPGFVDALSTLILGIIFLLTVFVVVQFYLQQEVAGKDTALQRLNAQIAQLTDLLSLEKSGRTSIEEQLAQLRASLTATESERDRIRGQLEGAGTGLSEAQGRVGQLVTELEGEKRITARALAQVEILNQQIAALRRQLAALESALEVSERKDRESQTRIADLGQRLNVALAQRVQELSRYRSDFFGRLRDLLKDRQDIRIVGDRFVFQSEVLFPSGSADMTPEGLGTIDQLATAINELRSKIPAEIDWAFQVDGHTDNRPIASSTFPSNWELSTARAVSVVKYLASKGVPPERLVAAGHGEFQPLESGADEESLRKNRRIELKLTNK